MASKIKKSEAQWREMLTPEQYRITREAGTEMAFSGKFYHHDEPGTYRCICCATPLFASLHKYDSGSGWPSFFQPVLANSVDASVDDSHGMQRTEVRCATCDAHLGHVFNDGPAPTGLRYCINSASLAFDDK